MLHIEASVEDWREIFEAPATGLYVFAVSPDTGRSLRIVRDSSVVDTGITTDPTVTLLLQAEDSLQIESSGAFDLYGVRIGDEL